MYVTRCELTRQHSGVCKLLTLPEARASAHVLIKTLFFLQARGSWAYMAPGAFASSLFTRACLLSNQWRWPSHFALG